MCLKRTVSRILLGRKIVEAKEQRDVENAAKAAELRERVDRSDKDSADVTMEIEALVASHGSSSHDFSREDD